MSYPAPILNLNFANAKQLVHPAVAFSRASQGSYFDSNGVLRYASAGAPRFDHDPLTGSCKGLLVEPSVTFLDTYSEQFDNATWGKVGCAVADNIAVSSDGTITADKIYEDNSTGNHEISRYFSPAASTSYTIQVFASAAEIDVVTLRFDSGLNGTGQIVTFNLSGDGAYTIINGAPSASITKLDSGKYLCLITAMSNGSPATTEIGIATHLNTVGNVGEGVILWGAKIYAGSGPTSYLPTTSAGVTRAADICGVDLTRLKDAAGNSLWTGTEGTIVIKGVIPLSISSSSNIICSLDDGTSSNRCYVQLDITGVVYAKIISNGVQTCTLTLGTPQLGEDFSLVVALKDDNNASAYNGSLATQSNLGEIPLSTTTFHIGCNAYGGVQLNSAIKTVKLYNRRIPDEYLPILSTL